MQNSKKIIEQTERYSARNYHPLPIVIAEAQGVWVKDPEGNRYMDMLSSYSALNFGHCHPEIIETLCAQAQRVCVTSRAFYNTELGSMLEKLTQFTGLDLGLPMNSGAEAVETALKIARKWGYVVKNIPENQAEIIVCENNFHGRTLGIISFSTEELYRKNFGPYLPGFKVIPYGDPHALAQAITPNTAAFLVEPIQGEAGVIVPPEGYLRDVRKICSDNHVLLILDEIQTGFARTGKNFAFEHEDIKPDLLCLGKALGGGVLPVSAVVGRKDVLGLFVPGEHGSTFGGNPLACAVAKKALEIVERDALATRAYELGHYFKKALESIHSPLVKEIRGKGLLLGVELKAEVGGARPYCEKLMQQGLLCKETHTHVIRFAPPLVITKEEIDWALERIEQVLKS